jgi:hypothetical protein
MNEPPTPKPKGRLPLARQLAKLAVEKRHELIGTPEPGPEEMDLAEWDGIDIDWESHAE